MAVSRGAALEFLEVMKPYHRARLYEQPSTALAIFRRMLPHLGKTIVMAMLYQHDPIPAPDLDLWSRPESARDMEMAIEVLIGLNVLIKQKKSYSLDAKFASSLRLALTGTGTHKSFGVPSLNQDQDRVDVQFLDDYARGKWEMILYYIVGSARQNTGESLIAEGTEALLAQGGLVELHGKRARITQRGFTFLLQDVNAQIWELLIIYLRNAEQVNILTAAESELAISPQSETNTTQLNMDQIEMLSFLFTLGSMDVGQDYSTDTLTLTQQRMLVDLADLGLIYRSEEDDSRYYPSRLATTLNSDFNALASFSADGASDNIKGFVVVETNYRLYAYTDSNLRIQILSLFSEIGVRYPNMVAGRLTKESIQGAISLGISAQQIIDYLTAHAHPIMNANPRNTNPPQGREQVQAKASLPPTVVDQIRLWQLEGDRMKITSGFLLENYPYKANYEDDVRFAEAIGVLVWKDDAARKFFVTRTEQVSAHVKARQREQEAAAATARK